MNAVDVYALLLKRIKDGGINAEDAKNYIRTLLDENPDIAKGATAEQLKMIEDLGVDVSDLKVDLNRILELGLFVGEDGNIYETWEEE